MGLSHKLPRAGLPVQYRGESAVEEYAGCVANWPGENAHSRCGYVQLLEMVPAGQNHLHGAY